MSEAPSGNSASSSSPIILVVDDDPDARRLIRSVLPGNYCLLEATSAAVGLSHLETLRPLLLLTELDLPDMDGIQLIRQIRARKFDGSILVVSARAKEEAIIEALDSGANDFVSKPYSAGELGARVRAALRGANAEALFQRTFRAGDLEVDFDRRAVRVSGREVHLTPIEYRLLSLLISNADCVLTYNDLLREIWKSPKHRGVHHLRVHIASLRKKLEPPPARLHHLITELGVGYQFHSGGL